MVRRKRRKTPMRSSNRSAGTGSSRRASTRVVQRQLQQGLQRTNGTAVATEPVLRVLSVNACCLPSGWRNARLPTHTVCSGVGLSVFLWIIFMQMHAHVSGENPMHCYKIMVFPHTLGSLSVARPNCDLRSVIVWSIYNAVPLYGVTFLIGWISGGQVARLLGCGARKFCGWGTDFKTARLRELSKQFKGYDVVAVQELFRSLPKCGDAGHVDLLIELASGHGLCHVARPSAPYLPSLAMDSGLLILSRFPILHSHEISFQHQFLGEMFSVNRGALHACIQVPSLSLPVDFFTVHVSPSMRNLLRGFPEWMLQKGDEARHDQFAELGSFIEACRNESSRKGNTPVQTGKTQHCIVAGDFNADVEYPGGREGDLTPVTGEAMKVVLETMVSKAGLVDITDGALVPTFGYMGKEQLLTNVGSRWTYKTDDLIFVNPEMTKGRIHSTQNANKSCAEISSVSWRAVSMSCEQVRPKLPFTHLSDHWGVELIWYLHSSETSKHSTTGKKRESEIFFDGTSCNNAHAANPYQTLQSVSAVLAVFVIFAGVLISSNFLHGASTGNWSHQTPRLSTTLLPGILSSLAPEDIIKTKTPVYNLETKFCNIERRHSDKLSVADFVGDYAGKRPVILTYGLTRKQEAISFGERTLRAPLLDSFGNASVILSASNSYTKEKVTKTLSAYIRENMGEQTLSSLGNETFYLFGDNYGDEWDPLMELLSPNKYSGFENTLSFGLGGKGSGVPFHFHGGGFSEVFYGRKRWFLTPQGQTPPFDPDHSMLQWVHRQYPILTEQHFAQLLECTIKPGEMLYFPSGWWHGVLNLDPWTSFVSTFTMGEEQLRKPM